MYSEGTGSGVDSGVYSLQLHEISVGISLALVKLICIKGIASNPSPHKFIKSWMKETKYNLTFKGWNCKMPSMNKMNSIEAGICGVYELIVDFCNLSYF